MCARVRACVRARVRVCVCVCVRARGCVLRVLCVYVCMRVCGATQFSKSFCTECKVQRSPLPSHSVDTANPRAQHWKRVTNKAKPEDNLCFLALSTKSAKHTQQLSVCASRAVNNAK